MHGSRKRLDPHRIPEKQTQPIVRLDVDRKPRIGQGRSGVRRKAPPFLDSRQGTTISKPIIITDETNLRYQGQEWKFQQVECFHHIYNHH